MLFNMRYFILCAYSDIISAVASIFIIFIMVKNGRFCIFISLFSVITNTPVPQSIISRLDLESSLLLAEYSDTKWTYKLVHMLLKTLRLPSSVCVEAS